MNKYYCVFLVNKHPPPHPSPKEIQGLRRIIKITCITSLLSIFGNSSVEDGVDFAMFNLGRDIV
jgi:hypothetical protein